MEYIVPGWLYASVIIGFASLMTSFVFDLTALAEKECPICHRKFGDVFGLRRHIKAIERKTAAGFRTAA